MALDRESVIRTFPSARRGYEPAAVDAHLRALADEVAELRRRADAPRPVAGAAELAGERVRAIIEAAEASAADIRARAEAEAGAHVAEAAVATARLRGRIEAMESGVVQVLHDLQVDVSALATELAEARAEAGALTGAPPGPATAPVAAPPEPAPAPAPEPAPAPARSPESKLAPAPESKPAPEHEPQPEPEREPQPRAPAPQGDEDGARLVALDMALSGTPRDEVDRYLAENFVLADREALLDDVFSSVG